MAMSGTNVRLRDSLLAIIADLLQTIAWQNTRNGVEGRNPPQSILAQLNGRDEAGDGFDTPEEFDQWRASFLEGDD